MLNPEDYLYVHFTNLHDAQKIKEDGFLLPSSLLLNYKGGPTIFAAVAGGANVPSVQQASMGRVKSRTHAVLFRTNIFPSYAKPEEVEWFVDKLPIFNVHIIKTEDAAKLLDSTLVLDEDNIRIPTEPLE